MHSHSIQKFRPRNIAEKIEYYFFKKKGNVWNPKYGPDVLDKSLKLKIKVVGGNVREKISLRAKFYEN